MITELLIRTFIRDRENTGDPAIRGKYASLAGFTGIAANIALFILKLSVGLISGAVSVIADAFNNLSDAGSSVVTLVGFRLSGKHADSEHPMGHGRMEYISAFVVDVMILIVGFELLKSSFEKILDPTLPDVSVTALILLGVAICVKLWMFLFYGRIAKMIDSAAIRAASLDSISDVAASALVLITAILAKTTGLMLDGWAGLIVAGFILFTGIKAAKETIELLLGGAPDPELVEEIYAFTREYYPDIIGMHDLMIHDYGPGRKICSFHAEIPQDADIVRAHEIVDMMERKMFERFGCIVVIHMDPLAVNDERVDEFRRFTEECVKEVDPAFSIHDFRMTDGEDNINLIFDMIIPLDCSLENSEAARLVARHITEKQPRCSAVIHAEHPFV